MGLAAGGCLLIVIVVGVVVGVYHCKQRQEGKKRLDIGHNVNHFHCIINDWHITSDPVSLIDILFCFICALKSTNRKWLKWPHSICWYLWCCNWRCKYALLCTHCFAQTICLCICFDEMHKYTVYTCFTHFAVSLCLSLWSFSLYKCTFKLPEDFSFHEALLHVWNH